jgi:hypothetical protein
MWTAPAALLAALATGTQTADTVPLFASDQLVTFTLVADFEAIRRDRAEDPEDRPARLVLADGDTLDVELRPRGLARRDPATCSFPPLRLDVKARQAVGTVLQGQDKLKMVVPCRPERGSYEQYVLVEYLVYKAYRLVTDRSFQVRLARVGFVDTGEGRDAFTSYAFLIEDDEALAARLGGTLVDMPEGSGVRAEVLNRPQATLMAIFQYLIGNTDWSDRALHNVKLVQGLGAVIPVPYDFDVSGIVNPPYAIPDPLLGLDDVRDRLYRGWCFDRVDTAPLLQVFLDRRADMEALFRESPFLDDDARRSALGYLSTSFESLESPERAQRRLFRDCRPTG